MVTYNIVTIGLARALNYDKIYIIFLVSILATMTNIHMRVYGLVNDDGDDGNDILRYIEPELERK